MNVFTRNPNKQVADMGEVKLIDEIRYWLGPVNPTSPYGVGDDCAIVTPPEGRHGLCTIDPVIYGQHFEDELITPEQVGAKLLKRNLSDIAAMGGIADHAMISLTLGSDTNIPWLKRFYQGLSESALRYKVDIVGGDISTGPNNYFAAHMALYGHVDHPVARRGANPGDRIWVTGELGGSFYQHHFFFRPRLDEGQFLAQDNTITSMMDISDGIAKDLPSLLSSNHYAVIDTSKIPIRDDAYTVSDASKLPVLQHAFCDGEDYELLFTSDKDQDPQVFLENWKTKFDTSLTCIGVVKQKTNVKTPSMIRKDDGTAIAFNKMGYQHL